MLEESQLPWEQLAFRSERAAGAVCSQPSSEHMIIVFAISPYWDKNVVYSLSVRVLMCDVCPCVKCVVCMQCVCVACVANEVCVCVYMHVVWYIMCI